MNMAEDEKPYPFTQETVKRLEVARKRHKDGFLNDETPESTHLLFSRWLRENGIIIGANLPTTKTVESKPSPPNKLPLQPGETGDQNEEIKDAKPIIQAPIINTTNTAPEAVVITPSKWEDPITTDHYPTVEESIKQIIEGDTGKTQKETKGTNYESDEYDYFGE